MYGVKENLMLYAFSLRLAPGSIIIIRTLLSLLINEKRCCTGIMGIEILKTE